MAFNNRYPPPPTQTQRVARWDPARPTGVIVDPTAPSYLPIPKRLPSTSSPAAVLDQAMTANLIVTANNSTYVQDGQEKEDLTDRLGYHRADVEGYKARVQNARYKERGCLDMLTLRSERVDPLRDEHRRHAHQLFRQVEVLAERTTSSASQYPRGNITFQHPTFPDPYNLPPRDEQGDSSGEDDDDDQDSGPPRRATVSSAPGDWGSVRRERGPLVVMNPGTTAASGSTRTESVSGSDQWSIASTTGYPPVDPRDRTGSRQHLASHAAPPPVAPPPAHTHSNAYYTDYAPGPSSATQVARNPGAGASYPPSASVRTQSVRPPPAAHVRHSSGSTHPSARPSTLLSDATGPTYYTGNNATPPYERSLGPFETQIADNSSAHGQYEMATHYVENRRIQHPQGRSRR